VGTLLILSGLMEAVGPPPTIATVTGVYQPPGLPLTSVALQFGDDAVHSAYTMNGTIIVGIAPGQVGSFAAAGTTGEVWNWTKSAVLGSYMIRAPAPVPLPAGLPLLLVGIGLLAGLRRRG
jgi:hypothetical protein